MQQRDLNFKVIHIVIKQSKSKRFLFFFLFLNLQKKMELFLKKKGLISSKNSFLISTFWKKVVPISKSTDYRNPNYARLLTWET